MEESILNSTKKILGLDANYTVFDTDVLIHLNSVFGILNQLGIGPDGGFMVEDDQAEWNDFLDNDPRLSAVKTYVYLRVRILFDPPTTSFLLMSMTEQIRELEWRLNVYREETKWTPPIALT
jgi:hypothetical protein